MPNRFRVQWRERALVAQSKPLHFRLTHKPNSALEKGRQNAVMSKKHRPRLPRSEEYGGCIYCCSTGTWWTRNASVPWFCFVQLQGGSRLFSGLLITFHPHALMFRISELATLEMGAEGLPRPWRWNQHLGLLISSSLRARYGGFGVPLRGTQEDKQ